MLKLNAKDLFGKYQLGTCTLEEKAAVEHWLTHGEFTSLNLSTTEIEHDLDEIYKRLIVPKKVRMHLWTKLIAAAIILVMIGVGLFFYKSTAENNQQSLSGAVVPGKQAATLTLADGRKILLSGANTGVLAEEAGVVVSKNAEGQLIYRSKDLGALSNQSNTLTTANGEIYQVQLPDGSKVWLNAASALKYPLNFSSQKKRTVELIGEAYFEVAKDKDHPFIVKTNHQEVTVLGTHFNVNAYTDELTTKTTLLEGAVQIASTIDKNKLVVIKPNQQATTFGDQIEINEIDPETVVDWVNGYFVFKGEDFRTAMRKVGRWYNVEIVFDPSLAADIEPGGWISRKSDIKTILSTIENTSNIHFKMEGRRVTVMK